MSLARNSATTAIIKRVFFFIHSFLSFLLFFRHSPLSFFLSCSFLFSNNRLFILENIAFQHVQEVELPVNVKWLLSN